MDISASATYAQIDDSLWQRETSPERRLLSAILQRAAQDYFIIPKSGTSTAARLVEFSREWIDEVITDDPWTFGFVCGHLGFVAEEVRRAIRAHGPFNLKQFGTRVGIPQTKKRKHAEARAAV